LKRDFTNPSIAQNPDDVSNPSFWKETENFYQTIDSPENSGVKKLLDKFGSISADTKGSLYKVDLPDEKIATMLDWDKPMTEQEMISLYQRRRITSTKTYVAQDPAYIARNLLQFTEGVTYGKTGLTYNSTTTGLSTNRTYNAYEYKSVYQSIKDLASGFFDFKIKPYNSSGNLVNEFQIGYPLGTAYSASSATAPIFQFPGNVVSYRFPEDGQSAANQLYGLGYGANNTKLIASAVDASKYTDGFPLLQDTANYTDIADLALLKNTTLGQLNAISYPPTTIEVVIPIYVDPVYPLYQIGDYVRFDIQDDYFPSGISFGSSGDALRIVALSFNPGENGPSNVTLTLTRQLAAGSVS
jgi:hypothetical protein